MKRQVKKEKLAKKRLIIESFIVVLIIASPFIFNIHEHLPTDPESTVEFLGFTIHNHGFIDVATYVWFMLTKLIPLYLMIIWFLTCKHWWYHAILIPLTMYAFQIFEAVFTNDKYIDTDNILWILPVCMVIIPLVYFIRIKLYDKHVHGIDLDAIEAELQEYKQREDARKQENKGEFSVEKKL